MSALANIIVCGGRVGRNLTRRRVWAVLDHLAPNFPVPCRVVQGDAAWVDRWAGSWALARGYPMQPVPIDERFDDGKNAPMERNARMARDFPPEICVGLPGGGGTLDMMTLAHDLGALVADVDIHPDGSFDVHWWPPK